MHCKACDSPLSNREEVSKDPLTGTYTELCQNCLGLSDDSLIEPEQGPEELVEFLSFSSHEDEQHE